MFFFVVGAAMGLAFTGVAIWDGVQGNRNSRVFELTVSAAIAFAVAGISLVFGRLFNRLCRIAKRVLGRYALPFWRLWLSLRRRDRHPATDIKPVGDEPQPIRADELDFVRGVQHRLKPLPWVCGILTVVFCSMLFSGPWWAVSTMVVCIALAVASRLFMHNSWIEGAFDVVLFAALLILPREGWITLREECLHLVFGQWLALTFAAVYVGAAAMEALRVCRLLSEAELRSSAE